MPKQYLNPLGFIDKLTETGATLILTNPKLDFTHFKWHKRGNLQVDGIERPGVPEYLGQLQTVKNLPAPPVAGAAPERWHPLLS